MRPSLFKFRQPAVVLLDLLRRVLSPAFRAVPAPVAGLVYIVWSSSAAAQTPPPQLGLAASGGIGVHAGGALLPYAGVAPEAGGSLDLGWIGSRNARLVVNVDYIRARVARRDTLNRPLRGTVFDFGAHVGVDFRSQLTARVSAYAGAGLGVHAVKSSITTLPVAGIYNTNLWGAHADIGFLTLLTDNGAHALRVEVRGLSAGDLERVSVRAGYERLLGDLVRPVGKPIGAIRGTLRDRLSRSP
jgi:hypothetical protein